MTHAEAIKCALSPAFLAVTDVTDGHASEGVKDGRALRADGCRSSGIYGSTLYDNH